MKYEIKYQVYEIRSRNGIIEQRIFSYDNEEQARKQYKICSEFDVMKASDTCRVELQEVIIKDEMKNQNKILRAK